MKLLTAVVCALAATSTVASSDVNEHCKVACKNYLYPKEPETAKEAQKRIMVLCREAWKLSNQDGMLCKSMFQKVGEEACSTACKEIRTGNFIRNSKKMGDFRKECTKYAGGHKGPFMQKSCNIGLDAGMQLDQVGIALRTKIDEMCASEVDATPEAPTQPEANVNSAEPEPQVEKPEQPSEKQQPAVDSQEKQQQDEGEEAVQEQSEEDVEISEVQFVEEQATSRKLRTVEV